MKVHLVNKIFLVDLSATEKECNNWCIALLHRQEKWMEFTSLLY